MNQLFNHKHCAAVYQTRKELINVKLLRLHHTHTVNKPYEVSVLCIRHVITTSSDRWQAMQFLAANCLNLETQTNNRIVHKRVRLNPILAFIANWVSNFIYYKYNVTKTE